MYLTLCHHVRLSLSLRAFPILFLSLLISSYVKISIKCIFMLHSSFNYPIKQARILTRCSHKLKKAVQSYQIVLHSNFKQLYYSYDYILSWNVISYLQTRINTGFFKTLFCLLHHFYTNLSICIQNSFFFKNIHC